MLPNYVLLDIPRCMNRDALEKIQESTRAINSIVNTEYASKPCRFFGEDYRFEIHIKAGTLHLWIHRNDTLDDRECFVPSNREWQECEIDDEFPCERSYPLVEMRQFLPEYVRFRSATLLIDRDGQYTSDHTSAMKSIAHICTDQILTIDDSSESDTNILSLILSSFNVLQCRILRLNARKKMFFDLDVSQYPALHKLHAIFFCGQLLKTDDMASLTQKKAICPESGTIFLIVYKYENLIHAVEAKLVYFRMILKT